MTGGSPSVAGDPRLERHVALRRADRRAVELVEEVGHRRGGDLRDAVVESLLRGHGWSGMVAGTGRPRSSAHDSTRDCTSAGAGASASAEVERLERPDPDAGRDRADARRVQQEEPRALRLGGEGPTQTITGTVASWILVASDIGSWSRVPALSSWSTTVEPAASASRSASSR